MTPKCICIVPPFLNNTCVNTRKRKNIARQTIWILSVFSLVKVYRRPGSYLVNALFSGGDLVVEARALPGGATVGQLLD
jgi:hypothetical protein